MFDTGVGTLVGASLVPLFVLPLVMDIGNPLGTLLGSPNLVSVLCYLVGSLDVIIIGNLPGSLPGSSVGMLPGVLLRNWSGSLLEKWHGWLLGTPIGLRFGSNELSKMFPIIVVYQLNTIA